jgi:hypothetical protein
MKLGTSRLVHFRSPLALLAQLPRSVIPPGATVAAPRSCEGLRGQGREAAKRTLDRIASREQRNRRQTRRGGMTREFPLVDLSKTPELPIWHKRDVLLGTSHPPCGQRCTSCLLGQFVLAGPPPMRAALHPFPGKPRADMKLLIKRGLAYLRCSQARKRRYAETRKGQDWIEKSGSAGWAHQL